MSPQIPGAFFPFLCRGRRRFLLASLALGLTVALPARGDINPTSESTQRVSEPPAPEPPPTSTDSGYSSSSNDYYTPSSFPSGNYNDFPNFPSYAPRRIPVFFPPIPPQLGLSLESLSPAPGRLAAPAELAAYVNEPFYAPLSTRLFQKDLRSKMRTQLEAYRATKTALQSELRARLDTLANADPFTRQRELAAFARTQTSRIAALEMTAEQLRPDLIAGSLFQDSVDWNESRRWQLGASGFRTPVEAIRAQYQVMRAAAFYLKGLSPAQRRLLREIAMELAEIMEKLAVTGGVTPDLSVSADANPLFFFSPETARIRLPLELPAALARKISDYENSKSALKAELRKAVYDQDHAHFGFLRTHALESLAEKQEPRIAALEALAEDIRRDLVLVPNVAPPPAPPAVPATITARMMNLMEEKKAAQKSILLLVQQIKKLVSVSRIDGSRNAEGRIKLSIVINPRDRSEEKLKPVRELVSKYNEENDARLLAIEKEKAGIYDQVVQFVGPGNEDVEKTAKDLLDESYDTLARQEEWGLYKDYRTAMLEPGLSPEQRRLLFDGALEILELPLPGNERTVTGMR